MKDSSDARFAFLGDRDLYDLVGRLARKRVRNEALADLTIHRFSGSRSSASITSAAARTRASPRAMQIAPGGPPDDFPV